jgi:hypothetical protein
MKMKTKLGFALAACMALVLSACSSSPRDLIVGKWETEGPVKLTAEFTSDSKGKLTVMGQTTQGTYKVNGDQLVWTVNGTTTTSKLKVTGSELQLTNKEGQTIRYKKV